MNLPLIDTIGKAFNGIIGLASEYIEDKDKRNEFIFQMYKYKNELDRMIINQSTIPWVDAIVKVLYAMQSLWRPFVSAGALIAVLYFRATGIDLDPVVEKILVSMFPAWGLSRHMLKSRGGN